MAAVPSINRREVEMFHLPTVETAGLLQRQPLLCSALLCSSMRSLEGQPMESHASCSPGMFGYLSFGLLVRMALDHREGGCGEKVRGPVHAMYGTVVRSEVVKLYPARPY